MTADKRSHAPRKPTRTGVFRAEFAARTRRWSTTIRPFPGVFLTFYLFSGCRSYPMHTSPPHPLFGQVMVLYLSPARAAKVLGTGETVPTQRGIGAAGPRRANRVHRTRFLRLTLRRLSDTTKDQMASYSSREAAQKLGLSLITLKRYIAAKKIPLPPVTRVGGVRVRLWTESDIERVRELLPKIQNGRKTQYQREKKRRDKKR